MTDKTKCPKCGYFSGDDWKQCRGSCPMPMSPHFQHEPALPGLLTASVDAAITQRSLLDHGFVRLIDSMGSDLSIARAARNSYDAAWRAGEDTGSDNRLIRYLWKNHHSTPFESVIFTFEVKAPIFVFRQWHRHRTWSFNEISARYKELSEEFYLPSPELIGVQSRDNKQARNYVEESEHEAHKRGKALQSLDSHNRASFQLYRRLLGEGWPRELARSVLPVATYSRMFATVSLLNLLKFIGLRDHDHAQHEIRVYAQAMKELVRPIVPVAIAAFEETHNDN